MLDLRNKEVRSHIMWERSVYWQPIGTERFKVASWFLTWENEQRVALIINVRDNTKEQELPFGHCGLDVCCGMTMLRCLVAT